MRIIAALFFSFAVSPAAFAATNVIKMTSISYDPKIMTIKAGDEVVWENVAYTDHYATADDGKTFDVGPISPKTKSKPVAFPAAGTYKYHCRVHGKTMSGTVVVQ